MAVQKTMTLKQMIESPPELWEMSDDELVSELSRNGWDWERYATSSIEKEIAIIQEALRRILQHQIQDSNDAGARAE